MMSLILIMFSWMHQCDISFQKEMIRQWVDISVHAQEMGLTSK